MLYLAIDQHAKQITVCIRNEDGDTVLRRQVSTRSEKIEAFFQQLTEMDTQFMAILEVCGFNDWLIDYCSHAPKRLHGLAMVSLWEVDAGVAELERCVRQGLKGAMIWGSPPRERPYHSYEYDPLWAAAHRGRFSFADR